jgi:hypothetical protein
VSQQHHDQCHSNYLVLPLMCCAPPAAFLLAPIPLFSLCKAPFYPASGIQLYDGAAPLPSN